jgi:hypothetical protein
MSRERRLPGSWLRWLAEQTFERETLDRVALPAIADLQHECTEGHAFAVRVRAYCAAWKTLFICIVGDAVRDRQALTRSIGARTVFFTLLLTALMLLPGIGWWREFATAHGRATAVTAAIYFLPATLITMALPMAFFLAVALRRAEGRLPLVGLTPATTAAAAACAIAVLVGAMFLVPNTNQAYRRVVFEAMSTPADRGPGFLSKGLAELSWGDLNEAIRHAPSSRQEALARAHRQIRFAVAASPFVLALLALGLTRRWRSRTATATAAFVALGAYATCFWLASEIDGGGYPSAYGVWAANLAFALLGMRLLRSRIDWGEATAA